MAVRPCARRGDPRAPAVGLRERRTGTALSAFADSSALVKLYAPEPGHLHVSGLTGLTISALARVEVPAAVWRKQRMGELTAQAAATLAARFAHDYAGGGDRAARFAIVRAGGPLLDAAAQLVATTGLRACDGVQLATAIAARGADPDIDAFACFDVDLRNVASVHGFLLHPATM